MNVPVVDAPTVEPHALLAALREHGAVVAVDDSVPTERCDRALADAAAFFALPAVDKAVLAIERSPHFRGYSCMENERDFREQMHFGRERAAVADIAAGEPYWRLRGPNQWPHDAALCVRMLDYLHAVERVGVRLLERIAHGLGFDARAWFGDDPYVLMKCIGYHAQPAGARRNGVAAHVDFSLLTLTLQDDVGGLELRGPDGVWRAVPAQRGAWLVNVGELLQFVTGNRLGATPHRVVNPSQQRTRCSIPVFVAPSLDTVLAAPAHAVAANSSAGAEHVHSVLESAATATMLHFGRAEWRRKGENVWCAHCVRRSLTVAR